MTAFVSPNLCGQQRLGVTASRKVALSAVRRNRVKRLLRESFRLSGINLQGLQKSYDWVLNAKRPLLEVKLAATLEDFRRIVEQVSKDERNSKLTDRQKDL
jgi:ribonuclease P protein component